MDTARFTNADGLEKEGSIALLHPACYRGLAPLAPVLFADGSLSEWWSFSVKRLHGFGPSRSDLSSHLIGA